MERIGNAKDVLLERLQSIAIQAVQAQTATTDKASDLLEDIQRDLQVAVACSNQLLSDEE